LPNPESLIFTSFCLLKFLQFISYHLDLWTLLRYFLYVWSRSLASLFGMWIFSLLSTSCRKDYIFFQFVLLAPFQKINLS
jgi:hypothetical protein